MITQVGLNFKVDVVVELVLSLVQLAAKFFAHLTVGQIGDVADHARQTQPVGRDNTMFGVMSAVKIRVGEDGLAGDFVEGDVLSRQLGRRGDHNGVPDALRKL